MSNYDKKEKDFGEELTESTGDILSYIFGPIIEKIFMAILAVIFLVIVGAVLLIYFVEPSQLFIMFIIGCFIIRILMSPIGKPLGMAILTGILLIIDFFIGDDKTKK